jgi:hypothetical protein
MLLDVANHIYDRGNLLEMLHLAGIGWDRKEANLPSWVVDRTMSRNPTTLAHPFRAIHLQYQAAVQQTAGISRRTRTHDRHIKVRGLFVDYILETGSDLGATIVSQNIQTLNVCGGLAKWVDETRDLADPYPNGQQLSEAIYRTIIGDYTSTARPAPSYSVECVQ